MCDETCNPYSYRHHSLRLSAVRTVRSRPSRTPHTQEAKQITAHFIFSSLRRCGASPRGRRLLSPVVSSPLCLRRVRIDSKRGSVAMNVTFAQSVFVPIAIGFFGLGTGYFIWGGQALFGFPRATPEVNKSIGMWGFWMPGFMQFITGVYLMVGMTWFGVFAKSAPLYYG